jgi:hypothetical protein
MLPMNVDHQSMKYQNHLVLNLYSALMLVVVSEELMEVGKKEVRYVPMMMMKKNQRRRYVLIVEDQMKI